MKSRKSLAVAGVLLASVLGASLVACDNTDKPEPSEKNEYTVTFDANTGMLTGNATVKVKEGEKIAQDKVPTATKAEHTFEAWYDEATGGTKINLTTYTVSGDVTLYAHYTADTPTPPSSNVKITFDANGGTFDGGKTTVEKTPDSDNLILDLDDPTRENHRFEGWYTAVNGGDAVDPMFDEMTESTTLYAHWVRQFVITFDANTGTLSGASSVKIDEGAKITGAPTASKAGNDFYGWFDKASGNDAVEIDLDTYTVTEDKTLYAHYGEFTMPLKILKSTDGSQNIGYTIEAEASKYNITPQEWWSYVGITSPVETPTNPKTSGGKSLGYLGTPGDTVTFTFKAAATGKAKLYLRATSSYAGSSGQGPVENVELDNSSVDAAFNGTKLTYGPVTVRGSGEASVYNKYWDSALLGEVDLIEGTNTLVLTIAKQAINLDCLDIETTVALTAVSGDAANGESTMPAPPAPEVVYEEDVTGKLIITDHAEGPAISKAVLTFTDDITPAMIETNPFKVGSVGNAQTDKVYLSDANGNKVAEGTTSSKYVTIEYKYGLASNWGTLYAGDNVKPFTYNQQTGKNSWNDVASYKLGIDGLTIGDKTYTKFGGTFTATYDTSAVFAGWDTTGSYTDTEHKMTVGTGENAQQVDITLKYAHFTPTVAEGKTDTDKKPLVIWLHGAGEGGTDPSIVLLGNQVVNLGKPLIQKYFTTDTCAGAYVLAPQSPTMWMDNGNGQQGGSNVGESIYTESLFKLIQQFVTDHADTIDTDRIYIGGCSNGGWMTVEMLSKHGEYFAAAYPIAVPFDKTAGMTEGEFAKLVNVPMWITHAKADMTVSIGTTRNQYWQPEFNGYTETNSNQLYIELLKAGAANVHYSLFENVVIADGEDKTPQGAAYDGHYSWIYTLRDECSKVQATTGTGTGGAFVLADITETATGTVTEGGEAVTLWGWIAAQAKTAAGN